MHVLMMGIICFLMMLTFNGFSRCESLFDRVGLFYRSAFCVVVVVMVEHFVEFVFCFMVCVVEVCLVFFSAFDFGVFCSMVCVVVCCRSLSCCFGLTLKMGSFVLLCLIYGSRFLIIVEVWSPGAVLLFGLWFLFAWRILLNFICALCWVLLIKEVYFLIDITAHF